MTGWRTRRTNSKTTCQIRLFRDQLTLDKSPFWQGEILEEARDQLYETGRKFTAYDFRRHGESKPCGLLVRYSYIFFCDKWEDVLLTRTPVPVVMTRKTDAVMIKGGAVAVAAGPSCLFEMEAFLEQPFPMPPLPQDVLDALEDL